MQKFDGEIPFTFNSPLVKIQEFIWDSNPWSLSPVWVLSLCVPERCIGKTPIEVGKYPIEMDGILG
jgi:hypothetical protein